MNIKNPKQSTIYLMVLSAILSTLSFIFVPQVFSLMGMVIGCMSVGVAKKCQLKQLEPITWVVALYGLLSFVIYIILLIIRL